MKRIAYLFSLLLVGITGIFCSCDDNKTYAELLADEKEAIRKFVEKENLKEATYITDEELVLYRKDAADWSEGKTHFSLNKWYKFEGGIYLKINNFGNKKRMFDDITNPTIIVRFDSCYNLLTFVDLKSPQINNVEDPYNIWQIDGWNPNDTWDSRYSSSLGLGLDFPVRFLGNKGEVSLLVPSKLGTETAMSAVVPYYYRNIRYIESNQ